MDPLLTVRSFALHEGPLFRRLRLTALRESPDAFLRRYDEEAGRSDAEWSALLASVLASPSQVSLVAEVDGQAVGLVHGTLDGADPALAHLQGMWVAPAARGRGVGRALVDAVVSWARASGAHRVTLHVTEANGPARGLYTQAGFVTVGEAAPFRADTPLLAVTMVLEIPQGEAGGRA